mgnify:CR=1 FL=1|tara:strand:- start:30623 stop:33001 length:2379 start_codon:yes stop_codon:yes gene_type:complete
MARSEANYIAILREWFAITRIIVIILVIVGAVVAALFWSRIDPTIHDNSLNGLLNRLGSYSGISTPNDPLLTLAPKYHDRYLDQARNIPYPRILLTDLRGWDGASPAQALTARATQLKRNRERIPLDCAKPHTLQGLLCHFLNPSSTSFDQLVQELNNFKLSYPNVNGNYGNSWALAISYDLARTIPQLPAATEQKLAALVADALVKHLRILDGGDASLWHGRSTLAASAFLLASVLDLDKAANKQLYSRSYGHFLDTISALKISETWPEGYSYWLQERGMPIALALAAFKQATPLSEDKQQLDQLMHRIGLWHIYLTRPDNQIEGWGDEGSRIDLKEGTRRIIDILAQASGDPLLGRYSHFLKNLHPKESYYLYRQWQTLLFNDPFVADLPINEIKTLTEVMGDQPAAALFGRGTSNHLVMRSGWGAEDTFISFRASDIFTHHQHNDAGHFSIFAGAPLAVNSSTYGSFFTPHRLNYAIRTIAKNSLLILDPDEQIQPNKHFKTNVIDGGQRLVLPTGSAIRSTRQWQDNRTSGTHFGTSELVAYKTIEGIATYIKVDITRAYNSTRYDSNGGSGKVRRVMRELLYLYPENSLIIRDEIITTRPGLPVRWLLHSYNKFDVPQTQVLKGSLDDGILSAPVPAEGVTTLNRGSSLRLQVLEPRAATLTQIGGPHYRYFIAQPGSTTEGINYSEGSSTNPWFEQPLWRTEIDSGSSSTQHRFVTVLQPNADPDTPLPTATYADPDGPLQTVTLGQYRISWSNHCPNPAPSEPKQSGKQPATCTALADELCLCRD